MRHFDLLNSKIRVLFLAPALLLLASCGSYQYAGYEHDGIYSPENREAVTTNDYDESYEEALYYKQLFAQQAEQFGNIPEEGAIFTNIEDYSSAGMYEDESFMQDRIAYQGGNAPWGDQPDEIAINIYNNSPYFYGSYMGPYYAGGFYDPFWMDRFGYGYGFGWNHWRYGYGYHNPYRWNMGFGWNHWGMNPWGWNAGWAYNNPYYLHGNSYGYPYYNRKNVSYSNSRRDTYTKNSNLRSNSQARSSRIQSYANSSGVRADRSSAVLRSNRSSSDSRTYSTRASRVESPQSRSRSNSNAVYRSNRSSDRSTQTRSSRSYDTSSQVRRSSSTSRSTPAVRSSSSSSRSSGTSSGSSRSSRGRGN